MRDSIDTDTDKFQFYILLSFQFYIYQPSVTKAVYRATQNEVDWTTPAIIGEPKMHLVVLGVRFTRISRSVYLIVLDSRNRMNISRFNIVPFAGWLHFTLSVLVWSCFHGLAVRSSVLFGFSFKAVWVWSGNKARPRIMIIHCSLSIAARVRWFNTKWKKQEKLR